MSRWAVHAAMSAPAGRIRWCLRLPRRGRSEWSHPHDFHFRPVRRGMQRAQGSRRRTAFSISCAATCQQAVNVPVPALSPVHVTVRVLPWIVPAHAPTVGALRKQSNPVIVKFTAVPVARPLMETLQHIGVRWGALPCFGTPTPETAPPDEIRTLKTWASEGGAQYCVTELVVESTPEKAPLVLVGPRYVPVTTPCAAAPVNVNPPPERFRLFVDESYVPVSVTGAPCR